jgi:hypothetical protein
MWWNRCVLAGLVVTTAAGVWIARGQVAHAQSSNRGTLASAGSGLATARGMSADFRIRTRQVAASGAAIGPAAPNVTLHLDRRQTGGRWHTSLRLSAIDRAEIRSRRGPSFLDNPFVIARMEYDDGEAPRMYDRSGRRVQLPGAAERSRLGLARSLRSSTWDPEAMAGRVAGAMTGGPRGAATSLVAEAGRRDGRRQGLEQRYGRATGRVRGLDRFFHSDGAAGEDEELLVAPESALPVEMNTLQRGALVSRLQLAYENNPTVGFIRRLMRSEQVINSVGARLVTDVETTSLTMTDGGAQ